MTTMTTTTLMPIPDINDVFTDGFLIDKTGSIAFLSLIGKDTAIQEFRARWSLPITQGGLTDFQVETPDGIVRLNLGSPESLEFLSGRLSTQLFGNLIQVFVYKQLAQKPDFANRKALQLFSTHERNDPFLQQQLQNKLWMLIKNLSPLPLLDQWKDVVLLLFQEKGWLSELSGMGGISANAISIPEDELAELLKAKIQNGVLLAEADKPGNFINSDKTTLAQPQCLIELKNELGGTVDRLETEFEKDESNILEPVPA